MPIELFPAGKFLWGKLFPCCRGCVFCVRKRHISHRCSWGPRHWKQATLDSCEECRSNTLVECLPNSCRCSMATAIANACTIYAWVSPEICCSIYLRSFLLSRPRFPCNAPHYLRQYPHWKVLSKHSTKPKAKPSRHLVEFVKQAFRSQSNPFHKQMIF